MIFNIIILLLYSC